LVDGSLVSNGEIFTVNEFSLWKLLLLLLLE